MRARPAFPAQIKMTRQARTQYAATLHRGEGAYSFTEPCPSGPYTLER